MTYVGGGRGDCRRDSLHSRGLTCLPSLYEGGERAFSQRFVEEFSGITLTVRVRVVVSLLVLQCVPWADR